MNPIPAKLTESATVEEGVNALVGDVKNKFNNTYKTCEQRVRRSPGKAILVALAAGYCVHRLPVKSLLVAQVRLMAALAPPVFLAFGAVKLCEYLQNEARRSNTSHRKSENPEV